MKQLNHSARAACFCDCPADPMHPMIGDRDFTHANLCDASHDEHGRLHLKCKDHSMYNNIFVALSLDHGISDLALAAARQLVSEEGKITAIHVYEPPNSSVLAFLEEDAAEKSHQRAKLLLAKRVKDEAGISSVLLKGQSAGNSITEYANTHGADCVVIASHQPGLKDFFLGSTAARVVRHAHCAVHVLRL